MAKKQPMYGSQASIANAAIAAASEAHALADSFDDEESEAALNALGAKINAIIVALENFGILES
jgi:hypothetical protein